MVADAISKMKRIMPRTASKRSLTANAQTRTTHAPETMRWIVVTHVTQTSSLPSLETGTMTGTTSQYSATDLMTQQATAVSKVGTTAPSTERGSASTMVSPITVQAETTTLSERSPATRERRSTVSTLVVVAVAREITNLEISSALQISTVTLTIEVLLQLQQEMIGAPLLVAKEVGLTTDLPRIRS